MVANAAQRSNNSKQRYHDNEKAGFSQSKAPEVRASALLVAMPRRSIIIQKRNDCGRAGVQIIHFLIRKVYIFL